ncbi:MAG: GNAT family N-acetyltransferase [Myxococcales bacterium]|nr:GNAT family N-acetyltransferase [Myxococcales bacterium]
MIFETFPPFISPFHRVQLASEPWQLRGSYALRREVFCEEQKIFENDDRDEIDGEATTLVGLATNCGYFDEVVATVRIHQGRGLNEWWGSRLAVQFTYRSTASLGAALVQGAVGTAMSQGCWRFYAYVQPQNKRFFERLHWHVLGRVEYHGRPHLMMEADLSHYQSLDLSKGFTAAVRRVAA